MRTVRLVPEAPTIVGMYQPLREHRECYLEGSVPHAKAFAAYPLILDWRPRRERPRHVPVGEAICRECHREAFRTLHGFDPYAADGKIRARNRQDRAGGTDEWQRSN